MNEKDFIKEPNSNAEKLKHLHVEYGGSLCAIINGKTQNIADYMNKKEQEKNE
jgi:hypothetical protein